MRLSVSGNYFYVLPRDPQKQAKSSQSEADMLQVETLRAKKLEYVCNLTKCKECGHSGDDWCHLIQELSLKECKVCSNLHGYDDTISVTELDEMIRETVVHVCSCGNTDPYLYTLGTCTLTCEVCKAEIPFNNTADDDSEAGSGQELTCEECANCDQEKFSLYVDETGCVMGMECQTCHACVKLEQGEAPEAGSSDTDKTPTTQPYQSGERTKARARSSRYYRDSIRIIDIAQLHEGDHVAWWRPEGYWHHALIERVHVESCEIHVVHYNGPSPRSRKLKGEIIDETLALDEQPGHLYRLNYDDPKFDAHTAIVRARSRLHEKNYNLFTNNCEHFVRWSKTGVEQSVQVENVKSKLRDLREFLQPCVSSHVIGASLKVTGRAFLWMANKAGVWKSIPAGIEDVGKTAMPFTLKGSSDALKCMETVGRQLYRNVRHNYDDWSNGKITQREFVLGVVGNLAESMLSTAGLFAGPAMLTAAASVLSLPVPPALVGKTLGYLLGKVTSYFINHAVTFKMEPDH